MLDLSLIKRCLYMDDGQIALADNYGLLLLWPFLFGRGLAGESSLLAWLRLGFQGRWCRFFCAKLCYPFLWVNTFDRPAAIGIEGRVT